MSKTKNSTVIMRITCAIVFIVFTFLYLYDYQADLLTMAQHVLSGGKTVYNPGLGAVLITVVLFLLAAAIFAFTGINGRNHAAVYFPSLLILTVITDVNKHIDEGFSFGAWLWVFPLLIILYAGGMWVSMQLQPYEAEINKRGFFSRLMWENLLQMAVMFLFVVIFSNHDEVFHLRMKMETLMDEGKYKEALKVGRQTEETDSSLTFLRIKALDQTGELGSRLFEYPLTGRSKAMKADGSSVKAMLWQDTKYHWHCKYYPNGRKDSRDFILTSYLLDRNLDGFVAEIGKYYHVKSKSLPKHFREALTLYTHRRTNPKLIYHSSVMDADFQDFQALERKFTDGMMRQSALRDTYGNTYWYYYRYGN